MKPVRACWLAVGLLALALGCVGIVVPLLPTTPFLLLAVFAFAQSSERLHDWLVEHPVLGTFIEDWRKHGAINRRAKLVSVVSMVAVFALSLALGLATPVLVAQAVALAGAATFVLTRPSPPNQ